MVAFGLTLASVGGILAWTRSGFFVWPFTEPKLVFIIAGVVLAWHWHKMKPTRLGWPIAFYGLCLLPSLIASRDLTMSLFGFPGIYSGSILTAVLCAAGMVIALQGGREYVKTAIMAAGTLTALICIAQVFGRCIFRLGPYPGGRAVGLLGSPIDVGALFAVLVAFAPKKCFPLYAAGLWASGSRGAWLGAVVSMVPKRWRAGAFVVATAVGLGWIYASPTKDQSDAGRREMWAMTARHLSWLGTGPATYDYTFRENWKPSAEFRQNNSVFRQAHSHNSILEAMSTRGIFGLIGLLALLALPELAGLWTVCMFNPVSFEVVFVACVLAGIGRRKGEPNEA